jgi:DNA-binding MarR family transcriptional regulator
MILTYLASADNLRAAFTELRDQLGFTAGNLSIQLKNLEDAGFVRIEKSFVDNKPFTDVALTKAGEAALQTYLDEMEQLIVALKNRS